MPNYERCVACRGSGVTMGMEGDIAECDTCSGNTVVIARDDNGRFK